MSLNVRTYQEIRKEYTGRELEFIVYKEIKDPKYPDKPFLFQIREGTRCLFGKHLSEADFMALRKAVYFEVQEI